MIEKLKSLPVLPGQNILLAISNHTESFSEGDYSVTIQLVTGVTSLAIEIAYPYSATGIAIIDLDDQDGIDGFCLRYQIYDSGYWNPIDTREWVRVFTLDGKPILPDDLDIPRLEDFANPAA
jgi:hypothetical protein